MESLLKQIVLCKKLLNGFINYYKNNRDNKVAMHNLTTINHQQKHN